MCYFIFNNFMMYLGLGLAELWLLLTGWSSYLLVKMFQSLFPHDISRAGISLMCVHSSPDERPDQWWWPWRRLPLAQTGTIRRWQISHCHAEQFHTCWLKLRQHGFTEISHHFWVQINEKSHWNECLTIDWMANANHGEHCARQQQSYLDGQRDVCISTKAASPVAGAVMEATSWGTQKSTGSIRVSRPVQVWRAPLFSTTITGNLKKAVIEFIAAYGNCYGSLEAQQWGYWHQNGTIQLLRECLRCRNVAGRREGVKNLWGCRSQSRSFRWGAVDPTYCLVIPLIHSTAAWGEICGVQRWTRRTWWPVICVDGWKCPQPRGKTA